MAFDSSAVLLAIRIGTLLVQRGQQIYVDRVRMNAVILPLPEAVSTATPSALVKRWLQEDAAGQAIAKDDPDIARLVTVESEQWSAPANAAARAKAHQRFDAFQFIAAQQVAGDDGQPVPLLPGAATDPAIAAKAAEHLFALKQWNKEDPNKPPSTERAAIAAVIEAAITWFSNDPRLLANTRPEGKALRAFLAGISTLDFARLPPGALLAGLLSGALDTVAAEPRLLVGGRKETALVGAVSTALAKSLRAAADDTKLDLLDKDALPQLAHGLAATVLRAAADTVLAKPADFFSTLDASESNVVQSVGQIVVDLALSRQGDAVNFQSLVSGAGLEKIARGLFAAVAANPDVIKVGAAQQPLKGIVLDLAATFATAALPATWRDALPAIAVPLLTATAQHLDGLWKVDGWDQLLSAAVKSTLTEIAKTLPQRKPLSAATIAGIAQSVIAAVAASPAWAQAPQGPAARIAPVVRDILVALTKQDLTKLTEDDLVAIVQQGLVAAAARFGLVGDGTAPAGEGPTGQVITAVFQGLAAAAKDQPGAAQVEWRLAARVLVSDAIMTVLDQLAAKGGGAITGAELDAIVSTIRRFALGDIQPAALTAQLAAALAK